MSDLPKQSVPLTRVINPLKAVKREISELCLQHYRHVALIFVTTRLVEPRTTDSSAEINL